MSIKKKQKPVQVEGKKLKEVSEGKPSSEKRTLKEDLENNQFNVTSKYTQTDAYLEKPKPGKNKPKPVVKVIRKNDTEETVNPKSLKEIILSSTDIKKIVIERVDIEDAKRVSFHFDDPALRDKSQKTVIKGDALKKIIKEKAPKKIQKAMEENESLEKSDKTPDLRLVSEKEANAQELLDFVKRRSLEEEISQKIHDQKKQEDRAPLKASKEEVDDIEEMLNEKPRPDSGVKFNFNHDEEDFLDVNEDGPISYDKDYYQEIKEANKNASDTELPVLKTIKYKAQILSKKPNKEHNGFYYRAKDHVELFKVGTSFLEDFQLGAKFFGFASDGLHEENQRTVFGVCSYFNYHTDVKTLIISNNHEKSFLKSYLGVGEVRPVEIMEEKIFYNVLFHKGFDILTSRELRNVFNLLNQLDYEEWLKEISEVYDLILWDLPEVETMDSCREIYFPLTRMVDSVSVIASQKQSRISEVEDLLRYFHKYQVQIKGLMFSKAEPKKRKRKELFKRNKKKRKAS